MVVPSIAAQAACSDSLATHNSEQKVLLACAQTLVSRRRKLPYDFWARDITATRSSDHWQAP